MKIRLHNTLTGKVGEFSPVVKGQVGLYVCGITPYDDVHLGHARCYVVFDLLKRVLHHFGYRVKHFQNFTNVDDKIIERAKRASVPLELAERFIQNYFQWMDRLNVDRADAYPKVTDNMDRIVALIKMLVEKDMAYVADGDVFFSVRRFPDYGRLSKRKIEELESGARVEVDEKKKDPLDFALWKKSKPGEPAWASPWGEGRPGWHIECSAMSMAALGEKFDIHGGGQDLIFPHHENEIAQSNGATQIKDGFAQVWMHNGFVTINKEKMSKSLGNIFTLKDVLKKTGAMGVRYFLLSTHYKSPLNYSEQDLTSAETTWHNRIAAAFHIAKDWAAESSNGPALPLPPNFDAALADDLNTPKAFGILNEHCSRIFDANKNAGAAVPAEGGRLFRELAGMLDILGFRVAEEKWNEAILKLVEQREAARKKKNWPESDRLREALLAHGVIVQDTSTGPRLKRK